MEIDGIDKRILAILGENSRSRNVEIASKVGLTEGAVRNRIEKLVRGGVIRRFTVETSGGEGVGVYCVVMLKAKGSTKKMMAELAALAIARDAFEISGEFDGCVILEGDSLVSVDAKIDRMRKCSHVADTRTFIAVKKW